MAIEVNFTAPQTAGAKTGTFTILSDAVVPNNSVQIQFTATVTGNADSYTVTFNSNGGSAVASQSVVSNTPNDPNADRLKFQWWYSDSGLTAPFAFTTPISANTTLYAKWTITTQTTL